MNVEYLLGVADQLVSRPHAATAGLWPRAAAVLGRQALESAIKEFWKQRSFQMEGCSWHAQLLCLREFAPENLSREAIQAYHNLSRACHYLPYEIQPNKDELRDWLQSVRKVANGLLVETNLTT